MYCVLIIAAELRFTEYFFVMILEFANRWY